jgi:cytochrome c peroxidase
MGGAIMIRNILVSLTLVLAGSTLAAGADDLMQRAQGQFKPIPQDPPAIEGNPATPEKIDLGRMLYFDPRLSESHLNSCQTCHNVGLAGVDLQATSVGHGWQKGPRNAPTVYNAVFNVAQFWDGRAKDLAEQAKGPVQANVEMNSTPELAVKTLKSMPDYEKAFAEAFPDQKEPVTFDNMARAIEVFEATLITPNAPFDKFLRGDPEALSAQEKQGLSLFMDKGCAGCHSGINVGGQGYFPFGVVEKPGAEILPPEDKGRFAVTKTASDEYVFRSPPLRNIDLTPPYFHSGQVWDLKAAVEVMGSSQLGAALTDQEAGDIKAFLVSLNGDLPEVVHPLLPERTSGTPQPVLAIKRP